MARHTAVLFRQKLTSHPKKLTLFFYHLALCFGLFCIVFWRQHLLLFTCSIMEDENVGKWQVEALDLWHTLVRRRPGHAPLTAEKMLKKSRENLSSYAWGKTLSIVSNLHCYLILQINYKGYKGRASSTANVGCSCFLFPYQILKQVCRHSWRCGDVFILTASPAGIWWCTPVSPVMGGWGFSNLPLRMVSSHCSRPARTLFTCLRELASLLWHGWRKPVNKGEQLTCPERLNIHSWENIQAGRSPCSHCSQQLFIYWLLWYAWFLMSASYKLHMTQPSILAVSLM